MCEIPFTTTSKDLSYSFPQTSHCAIMVTFRFMIPLLTDVERGERRGLRSFYSVAAPQAFARTFDHLFVLGFGDTFLDKLFSVGLFIMRRN